MKFIIFIGLAIALQTSLIFHVYSLIGYISSKKMEYFRLFMITAVSNMLISVAVASLVMIDQKITSGIKMDNILLLESGLLFIYMMAIKIRVTLIIIKRVRDPKNYHFSHFGKKIYNTTVVDFKEVLTYFVTFPFTMMAGAYFIVKIIR
jgi:hypothetical protein